MKAIALIILLCLQTVLATAQQLPTHNEFQELGLSFDLPTGWQGQLSEEAIFLGHNSIPGLMILTENQSTSASQLKYLAMQGLVDQGIQLTPVDEFKLIGNNRVEGFYQGYYNGSEVKCYVIGLINGLGKGMNIIIMTETHKFSQQHQHAANKLAASVKFFQSSDSAVTTNWKNGLIGKRLKYLSSSSSENIYGQSGNYNNASTTVIIDLCANASFSYYSNSHSSFDTGDSNYAGGFGYADSTKNGAGQYKISSVAGQSYLTLNFNNSKDFVGDKVYEYQLSYESDRVYLDNTRYFVLDSDSCY